MCRIPGDQPIRTERAKDTAICDGGLRQLMDRRAALKFAGAALVGASTARSLIPRARVSKGVIVVGGGIAGLSCAYELTKRGHEVTILEASGRTGGHVRTLRDAFQDGLYVDAGAENFSMEGYDIYRGYVKEFGLTPLHYSAREINMGIINGKWYSPEMLHDRGALTKLGFNLNECEFLSKQPLWNLPTLYFDPYTEKFRDEYKPFEAGLDALDRITVRDLLRRDGASPAAIAHIGDSNSSALHAIWQVASLKIRGVPIAPSDYRLKGGNQTLTDSLASRLGNRVRLGCPVSGIEHGESGHKGEIP